MDRKRLLHNIALAAALLCCGALLSNSSCKKQSPQGSRGQISSPEPEIETPGVFRMATDTITIDSEMRGVWITTVMGLDWPSAKDTPQVQQKRLQDLIASARDVGCNTIFLQVCSNMDAIYPSKILPWSEVLTGTEGKDPGYDPVEVAVECARSMGLSIHAWINPLRVGPVSKKRASNSIVNTHPQWVRSFSGNLYLDPGFPEVRDFLSDIAEELLDSYDFDGLHIDDYFYPAGLKEGAKGWNDSSLYQKYSKGQTLEQWRFGNIDALVAELHRTTREAGGGLAFGVSPSGRLYNTSKLYADPSHWTSQGNVDYLIPQIYWTIERGDVAAFDRVTAEWKSVVEPYGIPMFTGLAAYRWGETKGIDAAFASLSEFTRQVDICRSTPYVKGHVWFRTEHLLRKGFREYVMDNIYTNPTISPEIGGEPDWRPSAPSVTLQGETLSWKQVRGADSYAVFRLVPKGTHSWEGVLAYRGQAMVFKGRRGESYAVMALDGNTRSPLSPVMHIL